MITIMTPTYNRAYILEKVYESLRKQSSFEFEWVIVDDGSTDKTEELVRKWREEEDNFSITYEKQENGGKHRAVNRGVELARYDYFFILDSDDRLTENAVAKVHEWVATIAGLKDFAGVAGLKGDGDIAVGGMPQYSYVDATNLERNKYGLSGDKAEIYKTEVLKQYPFPEFDGENFLRETAVWDRIAQDGLKIRWFSEIIYLCEYIEDGLTKNTNLETYARNFQGYIYCSKLYIQTHAGFLAYHKCGEVYQVASLNNISFEQTKDILNINRLTLAMGIFVFTARKIYIKICKRNRRY